MKNMTATSMRQRRWLLLSLLLITAAGLVARASYLTWEKGDFLKSQGKERHEAEVAIVAHRGVVMDRNGEPLAVSAPLDTVAVRPQILLDEFKLNPANIPRVANLLDMSEQVLMAKLRARSGRHTYFLKRQVTPDVSAKLKQLQLVKNIKGKDKVVALSGLELRREYKRYYPMAEVASHLVGFTGIDNNGLAGMELALDDKLKGLDGQRLVMRARNLDVVEELAVLSAPKDGQNVYLSIDRRIQYLAYRELKAAVQTHEAKSASAILLDVKTGEVLAMVNQPAFNPNNDEQRADSGHHRNRGLTDVFEPGSTVKPFTVAAALDTGVISTNELIDVGTSKRWKAGSMIVRDLGRYGEITPQKILMKSSNIGTAKIALKMTPEQLWKYYQKLGFGLSAQTGFPGESDGSLSDYWHWKDAQQATFSYGYGMGVTAIQLARAYSVLANDGVLKPVSLLKQQDSDVVMGDRVMSADVARQVRGMLETVVSPTGTGKAAHVKDYRIAGKTGTAHKVSAGSYAEDKYTALFAGMAPASNPRLVMVVVIHDPQRSEWHGGKVAAPVFANIMAGALRLLNISPDDLKPDVREASFGFNNDVIANAAVIGGQG